jgi:hypothetical protein
MFHTTVVEEMKALFMFNNFFFNCAIYELMLKNKADPVRQATDDDIEDMLCMLDT